METNKAHTHTEFVYANVAIVSQEQQNFSINMIIVAFYYDFSDTVLNATSM